MDKTKQDHHNDGQTDASNDTYDPPHDLLDDAIGFFFKSSDSYREMHEENEAYDKGYHHTEKQK